MAGEQMVPRVRSLSPQDMVINPGLLLRLPPQAPVVVILGKGVMLELKVPKFGATQTFRLERGV